MKPARKAILCVLTVSTVVVVVSGSKGHKSVRIRTDEKRVPVRPVVQIESVESEKDVSVSNIDSQSESSTEVPAGISRNIFSNEDKLRTNPTDITSVEDFLTNKQLDDPSENFNSGETLSGTFIEKYLQGRYEGVIKAEQDYNLILIFRNGKVVEDRFVGEIFVEIGEVNSPRKTSFWNDPNRSVRVVTEPGKESILIEFLARNLPAPNRMLQLLLIDADEKTIVGNLYAMNDTRYVRTGSFQLKKSE